MNPNLRPGIQSCRNPEAWIAIGESGAARQNAIEEERRLAPPRYPTLVRIDFLNLFINQREQALAEFEDQRISLSHVFFESDAALSS